MEAMEESLYEIGNFILHEPKSRKTSLNPTIRHRLEVCRAWGEESLVARQILDIGCGQGESTVILAYLAGPQGHVTGIDPAPGDYGAPHTLGQAQQFVLQSTLGSRIIFIQGDANEFLQRGLTERLPIDAATLCHSLWYFPDHETVAAQFRALSKAGVKRVYIAEYTCQASTPEQEPHVLAAKTQIYFHQIKGPSKKLGQGDANVRAALEPAALLKMACDAGFKIVDTGVVRPAPELRDGFWEAQVVLSKHFKKRLAAVSMTEAERGHILENVAELRNSVQKLKEEGSSPATMDVFWAVLELEAEDQ